MMHHRIWGFIPTFLNQDDPRSTIEQLNAHYVSGWRKFDGFTLDKDTMTMSYDGDPDLVPLDIQSFRDDKLAIYQSAWVCVLMPDGKYEVCRMD